MKKLHMFTGFLLIGITSLTAQSWNGSQDSLWGTADNWTPSGVPTTTSDLTFGTSSEYTVGLGGVTRQLKTATFNSANPYTFGNGTLSIAPITSAGVVLTQNGAGNVVFNSSVNFEGTNGTAVARDIQFGNGAGEMIFNGNITRGGTSVALRIVNGTVRFTGSTGKTMGSANFTVGGTTGANLAGKLILNMDNQTAQNAALGNAGLYLTQGTLEIQGYSATLSNNLFVGSGNGIIQGNQSLTINGIVGFQGNRTLTFDTSGGAVTTLGGNVGSGNNAATSASTFETASDVVVNGTVVNNSGGVGTIFSFTKTGGGTMTLNGNNTYTGTTTVTAGTLLVNGNQSTATGNVSVGANGTLAGTGTLGGATTVSGRIGAGNSSNRIGELSINNTLTLAAGGSYNWEITDWNLTLGTGWDHLNIANTLNITATSGNKFTIFVSEYSLTNFSEVDRSFVIATADSISGFDLDKFNLDLTGFTTGAGTWSLGQLSDTLVLNYEAIPEPGSLWLFVAGCLLLLRRRR